MAVLKWWFNWKLTFQVEYRKMRICTPGDCYSVVGGSIVATIVLSRNRYQVI